MKDQKYERFKQSESMPGNYQELSTQPLSVPYLDGSRDLIRGDSGGDLTPLSHLPALNPSRNQVLGL